MKEFLIVQIYKEILRLKVKLRDQTKNELFYNQSQVETDLKQENLFSQSI